MPFCSTGSLHSGSVIMQFGDALFRQQQWHNSVGDGRPGGWSCVSGSLPEDGSLWYSQPTRPEPVQRSPWPASGSKMYQPFVLPTGNWVFSVPKACVLVVDMQAYHVILYMIHPFLDCLQEMSQRRRCRQLGVSQIGSFWRNHKTRGVSFFKRFQQWRITRETSL